MKKNMNVLDRNFTAFVTIVCFTSVSFGFGGSNYGLKTVEQWLLKGKSWSSSGLKPGDKLMSETNFKGHHVPSDFASHPNAPKVMESVLALRSAADATTPAWVSVARDMVTVAQIKPGKEAGQLRISQAAQIVEESPGGKLIDNLARPRAALADSSIEMNIPQISASGAQVKETELVLRKVNNIGGYSVNDRVSRFVNSEADQVQVVQLLDNGIEVYHSLGVVRQNGLALRQTNSFSMKIPHSSGNSSDKISVSLGKDSREFSVSLDLNMKKGDAIGYRRINTDPKFRLPDDVKGNVLGIKTSRVGNQYYVIVQTDAGQEHTFKVAVEGQYEQWLSLKPTGLPKRIPLNDFIAVSKSLKSPVEGAPGEAVKGLQRGGGSVGVGSTGV